MTHKIIVRTIVLIAIIFLPTLALADDPPDVPEDAGENVPIDGGVSLLVGAAVLYGAKKIKDKKNADQEEQLNEK